MSTQTTTRRVTAPDIRSRKGGEPIVALTAYTAPVGRFMDPYVDLILVGDSLGNVVYGLPTTVGVTVEMMINHGAAVVRGTQRACVVVDMPFGSYEASPQAAHATAARIMAETGASAIKLEGGAAMAETVAFLAARGIPVMGHIGLTPQAIHVLGGFRSQGRDAESAARILADARAISDAGAFAIVVEGVAEPLGREITEAVAAPTIGIGASAACDGQILVIDDVLGTFDDFKPKFAKRYVDLGAEIRKAVAAYADEVKARTFPGPEHCYGIKSAKK